MNTRKIVTGLLAAAAVVAAYVLLSGGNDKYTFKAELQNAGGVRENSSVKIASVPGGTVKKIELTPRDTAILTMELDEDAAPIGMGASIEVRPTDLLGERYVSLKPGNPSQPLRGADAFIPKSRTSLPVELDDVINTFDGGTRERVKILVNEFGIALGSRGKDLARLLDAMPATLTDARQLVSEITSETASLKTLLTRGDSLTASLEPRKDELASLVDQANTTLRALADRRQKIGRALDAAPGGLAALNTTLTQLRRASTNLRPAAVDLRAAADPLRQTLEAVPGFEEAAKDSLQAANEAAPSLTRLGKKATPSLKKLTPTLANLRGFSEDLRPSLNKFDERAFEDLAWMLQNIGGMGVKHRDSLGHQLGAQFAVNPETVVGVYQTLFNNPPNASRDPDGTNPTLDTSTRSRKTTGDANGSSGATSPAPTTTTGPKSSAAAANGSDKGILGGVVEGVTGLLGGNAGTNTKPESGQTGIPGLLNNLLAP